jgi:hypothetical protein
MKLRASWCAALAACLALAAFSSADAANSGKTARNRQYQMAADTAEAADASFFEDGNVEQAGYGASYASTRRANGFGVAAPLADRQYRFFAYGEYIYARASFSEALAYIVSDPNNPAGGQEIVEFDFDYDSSYRFGGGVDFCDCGGAVVFDFARYTSSADFEASDVAGGGTTIFGPYEVNAPDGGTLEGDMDVDIQSYDVGWAKTFCLGGPCFPCTCCDSCCDPCCGDTCCDTGCDPCCGSDGGCGTGCGPCCPAWELTWSSGVRFADVDWTRSHLGRQANNVPVNREDTRLSFSGVGLRTGLLGRRYFGRNGWFSVFAKGDISLLVGDMDIQTDTTDNLGGIPQTAISHRNSGRRVIPVTEIEAGGSLDLTNNVRLSSGYFIAAWHDLGMRDEFNFSGIPGLQLSHYDDANILGFDGFFARVDVRF